MKITKEEKQLILEKRAKKSKIDSCWEFKNKALKVATKFNNWLVRKKRGRSFSTFINEFEYQEGDEEGMYRAVCEILDVKDQLTTSFGD